MSITKFKIKDPAKLLLLCALISALLCTGILAPLFTSTNSDVMTKNTVIPVIIDILYSIVESAYISLLIAVVAFTVYADYEKNVRYLLFSIGVVLFKALTNIIFVYIFDIGFYIKLDIAVFFEYLLIDILGVLAYILLEGATLVAVWLVGKKLCEKHKARTEKVRKASKYLDNYTFDEHEDVYPFPAFLSFKHPILTPAIIGAIVITSFTVSLNLFFDFFAQGSSLGSAEIIETVFSYIGDIFIGTIGYAISYFSLIFALDNSKIGEIARARESSSMSEN